MRRVLGLVVVAAFPSSASAATSPNTVVDGPARFAVISPTLIRIEYAADRRFEDRPSLNIDRDHGKVDFSTAVEGGERVLRTEALTLRYRRDTGPFSAENLRLTLRVAGRETTVTPTFKTKTRFPTPVYQVPEPDGGGAPRTQGNLGGWYRGLDQARGPVRRHDGLLSRDGFYLLDDSATALLTDDAQGYATRPPRIPGSAYQDGYLFGYGHEYARGLADLRAVRGPAPLLPRKAFGNWFSRYAKYSDKEIRETLIPAFRAERVPLDVLVIDTDFKAPNAWNGWTWNKELFPDPPAFLRWAHDQGLDVPFNIHPSISGDDPKFTQAERESGGLNRDLTPRCEIFTGSPANADCSTFDWGKPRHVEAYFNLHKPFEDDGIDFWWLDWCCDGSTVTAPGLTADSWINELYRRRSEGRGKRWPAFSRIGGAFDQYGDEGDAVWAEGRNTLHFTGDSFDTFETLDFQTLMTASEGNIGVPYVSHDIGSFHGDQIPDDLYVRWVQLGAFQPINRLHSNSRESRRLPWEFEGRARKVSADFLRLRTRLVPFMYTLARQAVDTGLPIARGTYLEYPEQEGAYANDRQYLLGPDVLVAPVGKGGDQATKRVWFPPGDWTDLFTGEVHSGPATKDLRVPLERMPVFVKAGGIVPLQDAGERAGTASPSSLALRVQGGADGAFELYEDEGDGLAYRSDRSARTPIRWTGGRRLEIGAARGTYPGRPATRNWTANVVGVDRPASLTVDGRAAAFDYDAARRTLTVETGARPSNEATVVELGGATAAPACKSRRALAGVGARGTAQGGVRFTFRPREGAPVAVDVFQQSRGRTITGERLVRRFARRKASFSWAGRDRRGRRLADGVYFVRLRTPGDVARVALRRVDGRFRTAPAFDRRDSSGLLRRFKLTRPVFGGGTRSALGLSFRVGATSRVRVDVLDARGRRVRTLRARNVPANRLQRLRVAANRLPRGLYRVRIVAVRAGRTTTATLAARRL